MSQDCHVLVAAPVGVPMCTRTYSRISKSLQPPVKNGNDLKPSGPTRIHAVHHLRPHPKNCSWIKRYSSNKARICQTQCFALLAACRRTLKSKPTASACVPFVDAGENFLCCCWFVLDLLISNLQESADIHVSNMFVNCS